MLLVGSEKLEDGRPVPVGNSVDGVEDNPLLAENVKEGPPGVKGFDVVFELDEGIPVETPDEGLVTDPLPVG